MEAITIPNNFFMKYDLSLSELLFYCWVCKKIANEDRKLDWKKFADIIKADIPNIYRLVRSLVEKGLLIAFNEEGKNKYDNLAVANKEDIELLKGLIK